MSLSLPVPPPAQPTTVQRFPAILVFILQRNYVPVQLGFDFHFAGEIMELPYVCPLHVGSAKGFTLENGDVTRLLIPGRNKDTLKVSNSNFLNFMNSILTIFH
jgi:hypothetical protein